MNERRSRPGTTVVLLTALLAIVPAQAEQTPDELIRLGNSTYEAGEWETCAGHYAAASKRVKPSMVASASYNAACCYALAGNVDEAFAELGRSLDGGWRESDHLRQDSDLESLRGDPRWAAVIERAERAEQRYLATIDLELRELYRADQADRSGEVDWSEVGHRDAERRARVLEIMARDDAWSADDYFHAAMVFQHGSEPEEIKRAWDWASRAAELDPGHSTAAWLSAAAEDRYLMYLGKPQKYGTQFKKVEGRWVLWEVDPSVTDEERARKSCPPIAQARARAEAMNQGR